MFFLDTINLKKEGFATERFDQVRDTVLILSSWWSEQEKWELISETYGSGFLITRFVSAVVSPVINLSL